MTFIGELPVLAVGAVAKALGFLAATDRLLFDEILAHN